MSDTPRYTSDPTVMSFWSAYRIYDDRLELDTRLFGHIVIPFAHLERAELRPPVAILDLVRTDHGLKHTSRSAKLDLADLAAHIAVERGTGLFRQLRITPSDPDAFLAALQDARQDWQNNQDT